MIMYTDIIRKITLAVIIIFAANMLTAKASAKEISCYEEYKSMPAPTMKCESREKIERLKQTETMIQAESIENGETGENGERVAFNWNIIKGVNGYQIYRKSCSEDKYIKIKTLRGHLFNFFEEERLDKTEGFYYKVRGYFRVNEKLYFTRFSGRIKI